MVTGDIVASWPDVSPGWRAFNLNDRQHCQSLRRMIEFQPTLLAVGHGDPIRNVGTEHLHELVEMAERWAR